MRTLRAVCFWSLLCGLLLALPEGTHAERLPVKIYTSADGLGSGFVDYLLRDSRGFMWFCTRDGLSRFDGSQFVTYQIGGDTSPPGIESIYETRAGIYWISTTGGIYRFDPRSTPQPNKKNGGRPTLNAEFISAARGYLLEDRAGQLWLGSGGLYRLEEKNGKPTFEQVRLNLPLPETSGFGIWSISEADDGSLWINSNVGVVRRLPDARLIFYQYEVTAQQASASLVFDAEGRVWVANSMRLFVIKPEPLDSLSALGQLTVRPLAATMEQKADAETLIHLPERAGDVLVFTAGQFLAKYPANRLLRTSDQHIWMTTERELLEFDGQVFHLHDVTQGLLAGMSRMEEDVAGDLWIGGKTGLIRLDRKGLTSYREADGLNSPSILAINEAADGSLYFANGDYYLSRYDEKGFHTVRPKLESGARPLWTSRYALLDSHGEWWILSAQKLYRFSAFDQLRPLATYTSRDGLKANEMFQIFEDSHGDIWVSLQPTKRENRGLARFNRAENRFQNFAESDGLPEGKAASCFAEDALGNLWIGFYEGGLVRYRDGRFTEIALPGTLDSALITDLHVDRNGRLWIASALGGVARIDDTSADQPTFMQLTIADGLSSNNVRTITEDKLGNIYVGTVRGVDRLSPETNRIKHYSVSDGLASDFVVDSHCDRNGVVWFATTNGLSRLVPAPDDKSTPPPVWVGGLSISGLPQAISELGMGQVENLELSYSQNNVRIDFFGLDFRPGETLRYQYMLVGADRDWSQPTEQRTVTYANLQPGTYQFLVRAVNTLGQVSPQPATVNFKILPPIWRRWWFIALIALTFGVVAYALVRSQSERRKAVNAERDERLRDLERVRKHIATDLHDDIGSSLTQISILSEVVLQQLRTTNGSSSQALTQIAGSSRELVDTMSDIVWAVNPQKDRFEDLIQRMRRFASEVLEARNIELEFKAPENENFPVGANVRREILLIFKECINNIIKHSASTKVSIEIKRNSDNLFLRISDNGRGFDAKQDAEGHGLASMGERAQALGGWLELASSAGTGTTLKLNVPLSFQEKIRPALN